MFASQAELKREQLCRVGLNVKAREATDKRNRPNELER